MTVETLGERVLEAQFQCPECLHVRLEPYQAQEFEEMRSRSYSCESCAKKLEYIGSMPSHAAAIRYTFEKNGRIGIRTVFDGGSYTRSATREQYERTGNSTSVKANGCPW